MPCNFARDVLDRREPHRRAPRAGRARARRRAAGVELRRGRASARARLAGALRRARRRPGRRRDDADRQPARVGAERCCACFRHRRGRAAVHRAAAREGPAPAPRWRARRWCRRRAQPLASSRPRRGAEVPACALRARRVAVRGRSPRPRPSSRRSDPCLITFTSGTAGEPKAVRPRPALPRRPAPAGRALARRARGRAGVVHGRQRLVEVGAQRLHRAVAARAPRRCCTTRASTPPSASSCSSRERVNVLCMAPTEYRVIAKRATLAAAPAPARHGRRRRGAQPGGAARLAARPPGSRSATATARPRPAS